MREMPRLAVGRGMCSWLAENRPGDVVPKGMKVGPQILRMGRELDPRCSRNLPVQKFRPIEEMNKATAPSSQEPAFERFLRACARYWVIAPKRLSARRDLSGPSTERNLKISKIRSIRASR